MYLTEQDKMELTGLLYVVQATVEDEWCKKKAQEFLARISGVLATKITQSRLERWVEQIDDKLEAVYLIKAVTGKSLMEAKKFVEAIKTWK